MISEGSRYTKDWSKNAENSALITLKYIKIENIVMLKSHVTIFTVFFIIF